MPGSHGRHMRIFIGLGVVATLFLHAVDGCAAERPPAAGTASQALREIEKFLQANLQ